MNGVGFLPIRVLVGNDRKGSTNTPNYMEVFASMPERVKKIQEDSCVFIVEPETGIQTKPRRYSSRRQIRAKISD